ncbi:DNA repair helicase rad25 [Sporormia fimetaria CBS 119925]|uniref:DNA 3'-5' helicase n=1 Tax=Sporormia fimetaria CBS 119925 TaxID=1340428 RepID=A0A6A6V6J4_9PLEO|nr:DNA repair helicase rad25 [Sporormia fimetaria CBS 119925]
MPPKRKAPDDEDTGFESDADSALSDQDTFEQLKQTFDVAALGKKARTNHRGDAASFLFKKSDQLDTPLKPDHASRPLWIDDTGHIILESFSPIFDEAQDFLINIAEPQSRVSRMHEYLLTPHSLFAAVSVGHSSKEIIETLSRYSKTALSPSVVAFIERSTSSFGKVKIVLKKTLSYVESDDPAILQRLLQDPEIASCRADDSEGLIKEAAPKIGVMAIPGTKAAAGANQLAQGAAQYPKPAEGETLSAPDDMLAALREEDDDEEVAQVHSFQIKSEERANVIRRCRTIGLPLTEEYDFNNDEANAKLDIDLRPHAQIRYYQEKALSKMFSNSRARSGIIVLPCGAGKTLVGITAACGIKKSVIVLCNSGMSVVQWRAEFLKWSNINPEDIAVFTSDSKTRFPRDAGILISTYSMISHKQKRTHEGEKVMEFIRQREWGLMIADEVHVVPAKMFQRVTYSVASHTKLGLTATLLREDNKIEDLNFLIGPKLYEANWQELSQQGHIAKVQCAEVWCQMTPEFYQEWLKPKSSSQMKALLSIMNPKKFQACQFLIDFHEKRGDKVIVFSDNVFALKAYAIALKRYFIYGATNQPERLDILNQFQHSELVNTIFLSGVGDTSLDLPEATCLIQISSHYGSRRQEAQRLGRILRAKRRNDEGFNAFFYSLVSKDTNEMYYSSKRQAFLVDQGYSFKVITRLEGLENSPDLKLRTVQDRREWLWSVIMAKDEDLDREVLDGDMYNKLAARGKNKNKGAKRTAGTLSELSGGQDMAYIEYPKGRKETKTKGVKNAYLRKLQSGYKNQKKTRAAGI